MLTKNLRTHILLLRDGRTINITTEQYQTIKTDRLDAKRSTPLEIRDADTREILYDGEYGDIKEFKERKIDSELQGAVYYCGFGVPHPLTELNCECKKEFDVVPFLFKERLKLMGFKILGKKGSEREIFYDKDINDFHRMEYKKKYLITK